MKAFRVLLSGLVLVGTNIFGILFGFLVYKIFHATNQIVVQVPIAVSISIAAYLLWILALYFGRFGSLILCSGGERVMAYVASLLWGPAVFVPLHYFTQGYLTSAGNLVALALFQLPVNGIALLLAYWVIEGRLDRSQAVALSLNKVTDFK